MRKESAGMQTPPNDHIHVVLCATLLVKKLTFLRRYGQKEDVYGEIIRSSALILRNECGRSVMDGISPLKMGKHRMKVYISIICS